MTKYKSSKQYYYFLKFGFSIFTLIVIIIWILLLGLDKTVIINNIEYEASFNNTWWLIIPIILFTILHFITTKKASYIEIENDNLKIQSKAGIKTVTIDQIEFIRQIPNIKPPMYRLKIKDNKNIYVFVIYRFYLEFAGFVKDLSKFGLYIDRNFNE